jgi:anti-sigma regulatory factor (Ser/Thr protein kinase)
MNKGFSFLPGGIVILGGRKKIINQFNPQCASLNIGEAECYELDLATGSIKCFTKKSTVVNTEFVFDPKKTASFFFDVHSSYENLATAVTYIERAISKLPVDSIDLEISASELIHNAIKEATKDGRNHTLHISMLYIPDESMLMIGISDDLGRLNLEAVNMSFENANGQLNESCCGRGLATVGKLMSVLGYNPSDNGYKEMFFFVPIQCTNDNHTQS